MKRRNVKQAFLGEPTASQEGLAVEQEGQEAIELQTGPGRVVLTVPAGLPDDRIFEHPGYLSGELTLEDGQVLSFEIQDGAVGAQWSVGEPRREGDLGLNTLETPGGV